MQKQQEAAIKAAITDPKAAQALIELLDASISAQLLALEARVQALEDV